MKLSCEDCSYDGFERLVKLCGPCEEKAIQERIKWWQNGKQKLKERGLKCSKE